MRAKRMVGFFIAAALCCLTAGAAGGVEDGTSLWAVGGRGGYHGIAPLPVPPAAPRAGAGRYSSWAYSNAISPPDFNNDGKADVLWRNGATGEVYAWYMDGAARIGGDPLGAVADQSWRVAGAADFNSDGKTDLLWRNRSTGENFVWYMNGPARIGGEYLETVADLDWKIVGTADFDGDGRPDILWRNAATGENFAWYMSGASHSGGDYLEPVADPNWNIVAAGDFSGDGKADVLWRNTDTGQAYIWTMDGVARAGGGADLGVVPLEWTITSAADVSGDGKTDILWRHSATGENFAWYMDGLVHAGGAPLEAVPDLAWRMWDVYSNVAPGPFAPSDFDGDGKADVLWRNSTAGDLYVWTMDGVSRRGPGAPIGNVADAAWKVAGMADFDSSGSTDVLWRNYATGENFVWYMSGLAHVGGASLDAVPDWNWRVVGTGDFDGDGKADLLWRNYATGENYAWFMEGVVRTGGAPLDTVADTDWKIAGAADFTGDGKTDVLWRNTSTGQVYVWTMDGVAKSGGSDLGVVPLEWEIAWAADYSLDGKPDILWRNITTGENYVWYMDGVTHAGGADMDPVAELSWKVMPDVYPAVPGGLVAVDPVVGNLRRVPAGTCIQGSPADEPCRGGDETQFTHALTRDLAVMETEVTRQMWLDLKVLQPTLAADPTFTSYGSGMTSPVQSVTWFEAVLFANLMSSQRGLTPCYYTDAGFTTPVDASNYTVGPFFCNWDADGYRLPSEGEWEHLCRAGTATAFWVAEPGYAAANCGSDSTSGMYPSLETAAWFWGDSQAVFATSPVGVKAANPWNLKDVHGNVSEWCWDLYGAYPPGPTSDFRGSDTGTNRVSRGGGWSGDASICRSACRAGGAPGDRYAYLGFRLARGRW